MLPQVTSSKVAGLGNKRIIHLQMEQRCPWNHLGCNLIHGKKPIMKTSFSSRRSGTEVLRQELLEKSKSSCPKDSLRTQREVKGIRPRSLVNGSCPPGMKVKPKEDKPVVQSHANNYCQWLILKTNPLPLRSAFLMLY